VPSAALKTPFCAVDNPNCAPASFDLGTEDGKL